MDEWVITALLMATASISILVGAGIGHAAGYREGYGKSRRDMKLLVNSHDGEIQ